MTYRAGHPHKRFARQVNERLDAGLVLTPRQVEHVARLAWRYRRQIPPALVPACDPDRVDHGRDETGYEGVAGGPE